MRRAGVSDIGPAIPKRYLELLPLEMWDECLKHLDSPYSTVDLRKAGTVCQLFHRLSRKFIFRSLVFHGPFREDIGRRNIRKTIRRLELSAERFRALAQDDAAHVRPLVHEWEFNGSDIDCSHLFDGPDLVLNAYNSALNAFLAALPLYSNLRHLVLAEVVVTKSIRDTLSNLPSFSSLALRDSPVRRKGAPLTLDKLYYEVTAMDTRCERSQPLDLVSPSKLRELKCDSRHPEALLPSLVKAGTLEDLTRLSLFVPSAYSSLFFAFLDQCPRLQHLTILDGSSINEYPDHIATHVLPTLTSYKGPLHLAALFVQRRPVRTVRIVETWGDGLMDRSTYDLDAVTSVMTKLSESTGPVCQLGLPRMHPCLEIFNVITTQFPMLEGLQMAISDRGCVSSRFFDSDDALSASDSNDSLMYDSVDSSEGSAASDTEDVDIEAGVDHNDGGLAAEVDENTDQVILEGDFPHGGPGDDGLSTVPDSPIPASGSPQEDRGDAEINGDVGGAIIERDEKGLPNRSPDTFAGMMDWLALGHAPLPPRLEFLQIRNHSDCKNGMDIRPYPSTEERAVVYSLTDAYPGLRRIVLGEEDDEWMRIGTSNIWQEPKWPWQKIPRPACHRAVS